MRKTIKLSLAVALASCTLLQAADVDVNGYRGGTIDFMLKGMTVISDEKNGFAPSNGTGYLVKLKYETPDVFVDNLKVGAGMYANGDGGFTEWNQRGAPEYNKGAYGMVVSPDGADKALLGEMYVSYKHEYFDTKLGRQELDTPLTKIQVSLMPNFYEAYMFGTNAIKGLRLNAGHIYRMSYGSRAMADWGLIGENTGTAGVVTSVLEQNAPTNPNAIEQAKFYNMGVIAGKAATDGRSMVGITYTGLENLKADFWVYHSYDIADDYYTELAYGIPVTEGIKVNLQAQYLAQKDTGKALGGKRDFNMLGTKVSVGNKGWEVYAAYNQSGKKDDNGTNQEGQYFNAWGADPAYTSSIFSRNAYREGVNAYKVGGHYVIMKGLKIMMSYASYGKSATTLSNSATNTALEDAYEIDTVLVYKPTKNLMLKVFNAKRLSEYNGRSTATTPERKQDHYRAIASYIF